MTIVFLCGSIEPGCDGVGDYTRRLSKELLINHKVSIIGLNDRYVSAVQQRASRDRAQIGEYRIPASITTKNRIALAKDWINQINPDVISLQFVIYSFHEKGLPFGFKNTIGNICNERFLHIMFHETWLGVTKSASFKDKIYGFLQKRIILSLVKTSQPRLITTTNGLYKTLLSEVNITAKIVPLFSNISIADKDEVFLKKIYSELNLDVNRSYYIVGVFGNIYNDSNIRDGIIEFENSKKSENITTVVLGFGKISERAASIFQQLHFEFSNRIIIKHLGEFEPKQLSNLIQILDVAISPTPAKHIGKSGVYAALRLHGKAVIIPNTKLFPEYEHEIMDFNKQLELRSAESFDVANVAKDFSRLISQAIQNSNSNKKLSTTF
ncbi:MAG: hypothetical protein LH478_05650 [Chitinophagaceae bacterium]|nr:hypothetical protein [Chitinophagaceae bacterium]